LTTEDGRSFSGTNNTSVQGSLTSKKTHSNGDTWYSNGSFNGAPPKQDILKSSLYLGKDGWSFDFHSTTMIFKAHQGYTDAQGDHITGGEEAFYWAPIFVGPYKYPATGTTLTLNGKMTDSLQIGQTPAPSIKDGFEYTYSITFTPLDKTELKLEVTADNYDDWRPEANRDGTPGKTLKFTAKLVNADGSPCKAQVGEWDWSLEGTSREPGIALNYPIDAKDKDYDLRLDAGATARHDDTFQWAERPNPTPSVLTDTMEVQPYDWGGWSTLKVKAKLIDHRTIEGEFKTTKEKSILLPKRAKDSFIADVWKKGKHVGADSADDDGKPAGDGTPGDGLTNYEEYRGFYEDGKHIEGDPAVKDLFILNRVGALASSGIGLFQRISGIKAHGKLAGDELPADRVINKNHAAGPHAVDQHGLIIDLDPAQHGFSIARGGPSTPKGISLVALCADAPIWDSGELRSTVAHELMHGVNVYHHGETDKTVQWTLNAAGKLQEGGQEITVQGEDGVDQSGMYIFYLHPPTPRPLYKRKGVACGQHSGFDNCVMRYDDAQIYESKTVPGLRYVIEEIPGFALCKTTAGFGVNLDGRHPQSRYFDAADKRGKCSSQILVNDAATPPAR
jgi:hypothetical protein